MNFNFYKISTVGFFLTIFVACSFWQKEPIVPPPCSIKELMVDRSLLSGNWFQNGPPSKSTAPDRWGVDKLGVGFTTQEHGGVLQTVYRGRSSTHAAEGYFDLSESWFHLREDEGDWFIPSEFSYESPIADHYRFGCSIHQPSGFQTCQISAQYEMYLVRLRAGISPMMTYNDLDRILRTIDNKMAQCLDK